MRLDCPLSFDSIRRDLSRFSLLDVSAFSGVSLTSLYNFRRKRGSISGRTLIKLINFLYYGSEKEKCI